MVAVVHASFDLCHASHTQYLNTIRWKITQDLWTDKFKLLVWVESSIMTRKRKWKDNIYNDEERQYILSNLKSVDRCYVEFEWIDEQNNNARPAGIVQYLMPDIFVSHSEHIWNDEEKVRQQAKEKWITHTVIIHDGDEKKHLWEEDLRQKHNISTTNIIRKIIKNFKWNSKYDLEL